MRTHGRPFKWASSLLLTFLIILALLLAISSPVRETWFGSPLEQARTAYARRDWSAAMFQAERQLTREPENSEALRLKARSLARLGKDSAVLPIVASLGSDRLDAEDLFLIAQVLIRRERTVLGRWALEAASKLDPKHPETLAALSDSPSGRGSSREADVRLDQLLAIPSGAALSELVIGLAVIELENVAAGDTGPILARLLLRDRAEFLKIDSPSASRKVLARLLLDDGRTADARVWLARVPDSTKDREASWLLSRVALVEGKHDEANLAIERASDFGKDTPMGQESARYVGAKACAECHGVIFKAQRASRHATTLSWGESLKRLPYPQGPFKDPEDPKVVHRFDPLAKGVTVSAEVDGKLIQAVIEYALGSGHNGISFLAREESGRCRSLRLSYYTIGKTWGVTGGFNPHPTAPESFLGEDLPRDTVRACLNCHTTRYLSERERNRPEVADQGIGCERCHGPGDHHLRAVDTGFTQLAISRPKIATSAQRLTLCAQCHSANGEIPPSDPRFVRFQSTTLPYSRCLTESLGKLDCVTCHDPHRSVETNAAHYEARCLACHTADPLTRLPAVERVAAAVCPVNSKTDCVRCHMPKVRNAMPFSSFTDHHIRIQRVDGRHRPQRSSP